MLIMFQIYEFVPDNFDVEWINGQRFWKQSWKLWVSRFRKSPPAQQTPKAQIVCQRQRGRHEQPGRQDHQTKTISRPAGVQSYARGKQCTKSNVGVNCEFTKAWFNRDVKSLVYPSYWNLGPTGLLKAWFYRSIKFGSAELLKASVQSKYWTLGSHDLLKALFERAVERVVQPSHWCLVPRWWGKLGFNRVKKAWFKWIIKSLVQPRCWKLG